jgi:hypothetical protein
MLQEERNKRLNSKEKRHYKLNKNLKCSHGTAINVIV